MNEKRRSMVESGYQADTDRLKEQRRRSFRCFWTWPFGHYYQQHRCVHCDAKEPGGW